MEIFLIAIVIIIVGAVVLALVSRRGKSPTAAAQDDIPEEDAKRVESEQDDLEEMEAVHERGKEKRMSPNRPGRSDAIADQEGKSE